MSHTPTLPPSMKDRLAEGEPLIGGWVASGSTVAAEIMAGSGLDWVLIDGEHGPNDLGAILAQLQAAAAYPAVAAVRVPVNDAAIIKQVLDLDAQTIVVPMVHDADDARAAVAAAGYPQTGGQGALAEGEVLGLRGVGSALARSARWGAIPGYLLNASDHISVIVQIESGRAVENVEEIMAVPGVAGVFVGPSDLAASMGHLGKQDHEEVTAAVNAVIEAGTKAGVPVGVNAFDHTLARRYLDAGARFVNVCADVSLMAAGARAAAERLG